MRISLFTFLVFAITLISGYSNCTNKYKEELNIIDGLSSDNLLCIQFNDETKAFVEMKNRINSLDIKKLRRKDKKKHAIFSIQTKLFRIDNSFKADSVISILKSYSEYYRLKEDSRYQSLCQYLAAFGEYRCKRLDKSMSLIKDCKLVANKKDSSLIAAIYILESRLLNLEKNFDYSIEILEKGIDYIPISSDLNNRINAELLLTSYYTRVGEYNKANAIIQKWEKKSLPMNIQNKLLSQKVGLYKKTHKTRQLIELMTANERLVEQDSSFYGYLNIISQEYAILNDYSKAIEYAKKSLESNNYNGGAMHLLAKYYAEKGDYIESSKYYEMFIDYYRRFVTKRQLEHLDGIRQQQINDIIKQNEIEKKSTRNKNRIIIISLICFLIIVCASFLIINILIKRKEKYDAEIKRDKMIQSIINGTVRMIPDMMTELTNAANVSTKYSPEVYERLDKILNTYKVNCRNNIIQFISNEKYGYLNQELLNSLSPQEKVITILFEEGISIQEISEILCITSNNVRSSRSRIKKKIAVCQSPVIPNLKIIKN